MKLYSNTRRSLEAIRAMNSIKGHRNVKGDQEFKKWLDGEEQKVQHRLTNLREASEDSHEENTDDEFEGSRREAASYINDTKVLKVVFMLFGSLIVGCVGGLIASSLTTEINYQYGWFAVTTLFTFVAAAYFDA